MGLTSRGLAPSRRKQLLALFNSSVASERGSPEYGAMTVTVIWVVR